MGDQRASIPQAVICSLAQDSEATMVRATEEEITTSSGAATGHVVRYVGQLRHGDGRIEDFRAIRKSLRPLESGRHAAFANVPGHWAYWRREFLAYSSEVLPAGPCLVAPKCFGTDGNDLYLEAISGSRETIDRAAMHLADWQSRSLVPDLPWLTRDQLGQRVSVTTLDWQSVDADPRAVDLWNRRESLLQRLASLPRVLSHGDYALDNLIARGRETVALDWATLGTAAVGSDLAHLALSASADPTTYFLEASKDFWRSRDVVAGFQAALALVGSSRVHYMLSRELPLPEGYVDFLWENRPE